MVVSCGDGFVVAQRTRLHPLVHLRLEPHGLVLRNDPRTRKLPRADPRPERRAVTGIFCKTCALLRNTSVGCSAAASLFVWLIALLLGIRGALEVAALNENARHDKRSVERWGDGRPAYQPEN